MFPVLPSSGKTRFFSNRLQCTKFCISFLPFFQTLKRFVSLWDGKPGHSFRWRASQWAFPQVNSSETVIGNGKFTKKIRYFYKNLLISFVFFSLYVCKPLKQTLLIIDYATIYLPHPFPSHGISAPTCHGAPNAYADFLVFVFDLDGYFWFRWLQRRN